MTTLSSKKIAAMKPREKRYSIADGNGLTLRVMPSGKKIWYLRTSSSSRVADKKLGEYPDMNLAQARQKARRLRKDIGLEPPKGYVLKDAFRLWCRLKKPQIVSYQDERRRLERYIIGPIGNRQLDEITAPLVIRTVQPIEKDGKQATLKRVLMRLREILDLSVCAGYIEHNPLARVSRVFAPPTVTPMPAVGWKDLPEVMRVMADAPERMQILFLFSLCSMLRPGENAKLEKSWIHDDVIEIPAEHMKKRKPFRLPLTGFMRELLEREAALSPHPRCAFVFAARVTGRHISAQALAKHLHSTELKGRLVAHGLRSIARSWLADEAVPFDVAEMCLSHDVGTQVSRAYQRSDFFDARRSVMERWSEHVRACAESAGMIDWK